MSVEEEKKILNQPNDESETQNQRIAETNLYMSNFLTAMLREAIGRGDITIDKGQAGFIIKYGENVFEDNGEGFREFYERISTASEK